jgi:PAP2 superfamily
MLRNVRTAEGINTLTFSFFVVCAWLRPLSRRQRVRASAFGLAGILLTLAAYFAQASLRTPALSIVRDWLPVPLMMFVYWQTGQFFSHRNGALEARLLALDDKILGAFLGRRTIPSLNAAAASAFEFAYLFCYPLIPIGMLALYVLGLRVHADDYWAAVLPPTYLCYALLPFIQMFPPRLLAADRWRNLSRGPIRDFNLWVLRHGSIQVNTFPSAHVASTMSASLVLLRLAPPVGVIFLVMAVGIALGAVFGRYHYAADAIAAAALALVSSIL